MTHPQSKSPKHAWAISLTFWLCLLCAAGLYSAIALAPKYLIYLTLKNKYHATQVQLVTLKQQVGDMRKVIEALESNPEFSEELARADFDAARPGDERITVETSLTLNTRIPEANSAIPTVTLPWYDPLLKASAKNGKLRTATLTLSTVLIILAFTFFHDSQSRQIRTTAGVIRGGLAFIAQRYRKHPR